MNPYSQHLGNSSLISLPQLRQDLRRYAGADTVINVMSIDLEEWFQVTNFENIISRSQWDTCLSRIQEVLPRLLDLFTKHHVRATFFVLGWLSLESKTKSGESVPAEFGELHGESRQLGSRHRSLKNPSDWVK